MPNNKQAVGDGQQSIKIEIFEQVANLATAGFGLVAALAWNDAIKALFAAFFPQPSGNIMALFIYALLITILVVFVTTRLGRAVNLAKNQLVKNKK